MHVSERAACFHSGYGNSRTRQSLARGQNQVGAAERFKLLEHFLLFGQARFDAKYSLNIMLDPLGPISVYKRGDDCVAVEESKREGMEPGGRGEGHVARMENEGGKVRSPTQSNYQDYNHCHSGWTCLFSVQ